MERPLVGRVILIVEDQPLIALDVASTFEKAGAKVKQATTLRHAMSLAEDDDLSAAVLDHALGDGDSSQLCERLKERDIPFVLHSGYSKLEGACSEGVVMGKPVHPDMLVMTVAGLLRSHPIAN
jgi:DNA-binding response OmpR family regulator